MIDSMMPDLQLEHLKINTLTLERNAVLVVRLDKNSGYDLSELQSLREYLKKIFPTHEVFVWWDDIDFMAIYDHGYAPERMSVVNETQNYY